MNIQKFEMSLTLFNDIKMSDGADVYPTGNLDGFTSPVLLGLQVRAIDVIASPWTTIVSQRYHTFEPYFNKCSNILTR